MTRSIGTQADRRFRLEVQRAQADQDIEDIAGQLAAGDIDQATAGRLEEKYRAELESVTVELGSLGESDTERTRTFSSRRIIGAVILAIAFVAVTILAAGAIRPRTGGFINGSGAVNSVDLDQVSNDQLEAVIAANPDNPEIGGMRVALANRYFEEGVFSNALENYLAGLGGALAPARRAQALGRVAWMTFLSGETDVAELYLQQALETDPRYAEGKFFYGLLLMEGLDQPCEAVPYLEAAASAEEIPDEVRAELEAATLRAVDGCT